MFTWYVSVNTDEYEDKVQLERTLALVGWREHCVCGIVSPGPVCVCLVFAQFTLVRIAVCCQSYQWP